jgi:hypothetical protein
MTYSYEHSNETWRISKEWLLTSQGLKDFALDLKNKAHKVGLS